MAQPAKVSSIEPRPTKWLPEISWQEIREAGCYVEVGSGDLYRFPKEAMMNGGGPLVRKESVGASRVVKISDNPYLTTLEARMICAEHNISPNF